MLTLALIALGVTEVCQPGRPCSFDVTISARMEPLAIVTQNDTWRETGLLIVRYEETVPVNGERPDYTEEWWIGGSMAIAPTLIPGDHEFEVQIPKGMLAVRLWPLPLLIADRRDEKPVQDATPSLIAKQ